MSDNVQAKAAIKAAWIAGTLGCVGVTLAAIIGLGLPYVQKMAGQEEPETAVIVVTTTAPQLVTQSTAPTQTPLTGSANTNASCQAIIGRLPNSPQEVQVKFGIPADKDIRLFYEICQEVPNGFIVEESPSLFTLQVPQGGCIDSYSGAKFSDATVPEKLGGGRRAYSGFVTTTSLTYRIAGCELKP